MAFVKFYFELEVYKLSGELASEVCQISRNFPVEEKFSLTDQIHRSSRSIGAQIADCWAKRRYINHFVSKLTDADAKQYEKKHWMEVAHDCNLVPSEIHDAICARCDPNKFNLFNDKQG